MVPPTVQRGHCTTLLSYLNWIRRFLPPWPPPPLPQPYTLLSLHTLSGSVRNLIHPSLSLSGICIDNTNMVLPTHRGHTWMWAEVYFKFGILNADVMFWLDSAFRWFWIRYKLALHNVCVCARTFCKCSFQIKSRSVPFMISLFLQMTADIFFFYAR